MKSPGSRPGTFLQYAGSAIPPPFSHSGKSSSPTHWEYRTLCLTLSEQLHTRSDRDQGSLQTRFPAPTMFQTHLMRARLFFRKTVSSAWFVDSAVRWRRNGAGGLRKIVFCCSAFLVSSRPVLTEVLEMSSCRSQLSEFCEPPQGGASARTAERRCLSLQAAVAPNIFSLHPFRVAASCLFQSAAEFANNSVVCHSEEQSDEESVTLPKIDS